MTPRPLRQPPSAIELLCALADTGDGTYSARGLGGFSSPPVAQLVGAGLLVPGARVNSLTCEECDRPHQVLVEWHPEEGRVGWYCPEIGFIPSDQDAVAVSFRMERMAIGLGEAFGASFESGGWRTQPFAGGRAWHVGRFLIARQWVIVMVAGGLRETDAVVALARAITEGPRSGTGLLLTTSEETRRPDIFRPFHVIELARAVSIRVDGDGLQVDVPFLTRQLAGTSPARPRRGGRPALEAEIWRVADALHADGLRAPSEIYPRDIEGAWPQHYPGDPPVASTIGIHLTSWRERVAGETKPD